MNRIKPHTLLIALVSVVLAGGLALYALWRPVPPPPPVAIRSEAQAAINEVLKSHESQEWEQAVKRWNERLTEKSLNDLERASMENYRRVAEENHKNKAGPRELVFDGKDGNPKAPQPPTPFPAKQADTDPDPKDVFKSYYPAGRRSRSIGDFIANGTGVNKGWVLQSKVNFAYRYEVIAETEVLENNGNRATVRVAFREVTQVRAISTEKISFHAPDQPMLDVVWETLQWVDLVPVPDPRIVIVKEIGKLLVAEALKMDPGLEKTCTFTVERLRKQGWLKRELRDDEQLIAKIESLSGQELEIDYLRDIGITSIRVCKGQQLSNDVLEGLAYNSSLLMDYYIFPKVERAKGEQWDVEAADVSGLANLGYDVSVAGKLTIESKDEVAASDNKLAKLEIVGGQVEGTVMENGKKKSFTLVPKAGNVVEYQTGNKTVESARIEWKGKLDTVPDNHLLHGTETSSVDIKTCYESKRLPNRAANEKPVGCVDVER